MNIVRWPPDRRYVEHGDGLHRNESAAGIFSWNAVPGGNTRSFRPGLRGRSLGLRRLVHGSGRFGQRTGADCVCLSEYPDSRHRNLHSRFPDVLTDQSR